MKVVSVLVAMLSFGTLSCGTRQTGLNQTSITCPAGRTFLDGVCVNEAVADYVACVRAQGAHLGGKKGERLSADAGGYGVKAEGVAEVNESLEKQYMASDQAVLEIIRVCSRSAGMTATPSPAPASIPSPTPVNLAPAASATASSENAPAQAATKAIDGSPAGYPSDSTREWATIGGKAGSWLKLVWSGAPVVLTRIVLHDRPNPADQITSAGLEFDDGTTVPVGPLPNDGTALELVLAPARTSKSVRLVILKVSPTTENAGLAEIEAWGTR